MEVGFGVWCMEWRLLQNSCHVKGEIMVKGLMMRIEDGGKSNLVF